MGSKGVNVWYVEDTVDAFDKLGSSLDFKQFAKAAVTRAISEYEALVCRGMPNAPEVESLR